MFGIGKVGEAIKMAQQQQNKLKGMQVTGESRDHLVKVQLNGLFEMLSINIDETLVQRGNAQDIKRDIMDAFNNARKAMEKEMQKGMDVEQAKKMLGL